MISGVPPDGGQITNIGQMNIREEVVTETERTCDFLHPQIPVADSLAPRINFRAQACCEESNTNQD